MPIRQQEMDNTSILQDISRHLAKSGQTIAVAESVTSGDVQSAFSLAKDALQFFQGGITVYNITQKVRHLHVDPIHALSCNCVSNIIAEEMAKNVIKLFTSDWGIGVTGYASPVPEKGVEELFAFMAIYYKEECKLSATLFAEKQDPGIVRQFYTHQILLHFSNTLEKCP